MADILPDTQPEQSDVPLVSLLLHILEQTLRVPHLPVRQQHHFQIQPDQAPLDGRFDSRKDLGATEVSLHTIAVLLRFDEGLVAVWPGSVPEERVMRAERADVEVDVKREGLEQYGDGGFEGCRSR